MTLCTAIVRLDLTLLVLGKNSADDVLEYLFYFPREKDFDI